MVLALLLLGAGEVVSVDRLIDGIWGARPPKTAVAVIQNCISRLRGELGQAVIERKAPGYLLHADEEAIDARRFARRVAEARRLSAPERLALLTEALSLWRGSALADFTFEEFAQAAVQELEALRFEAMEGRIAASLELGRHVEVIGEIEALAAAHRSRERLRYLQMLALYRAGRQVDALEVFQETRLALAEELGLEPSEELKALERMILAHDPALDRPGDGIVPRGQAPVREARRVVSVLFAEPVLPETLDTEARRAAAARCLAVAAAVVDRHGGRIEQLEGTELAGAFGLPRAHEDDALRATRAAVEIRAECASLGIEVRSGIEGVALDVAGDLVDETSLAEARSVKATASAGEILIGPAALRVLSGAVDVVPAAGTGFTLLRLIEGAPAVQRRFDAALVGRAAELDALEASVLAAWEQGTAQFLVVLGEPGIGKTRLAGALVSRLGDRALALSGRCVPYGEGTTYLPLADVIREAAGPGDLRRAIARRTRGVPDAERIVERIAGVVTGGTAAAQNTEIFWATRRYLEALAAGSPAARRPRRRALGRVHPARPRRVHRRLVRRHPSHFSVWRDPNCSKRGPVGRRVPSCSRGSRTVTPAQFSTPCRGVPSSRRMQSGRCSSRPTATRSSSSRSQRWRPNDASHPGKCHRRWRRSSQAGSTCCPRRSRRPRAGSRRRAGVHPRRGGRALTARRARRGWPRA